MGGVEDFGGMARRLANTPDPITGMTNVLVSSFAILGLGYVMKRTNTISPEAGSGIGQLIGKIALPALLFKAMATLDLGDIDFSLLGAMMVGKAVVFVVAALYALLADKTPTRISKAGVYAVFVTQSNDIGFGFPIAIALFPDLVPYLFLAAPFQLMVLTPAAFALMEAGAPNRDKNAGCMKTALKITRNVLFNPVVASTILGLLYKVVINEPLPDVVEITLKTMGNAFAVGALFGLGMGMVGKMGVLKGSKLVLPMLLTLIKALLLPILVRSILVAFGTSDEDKLNFSYVYGTLPTAPSVYGFAVTFNSSPDLVAGATVICTFVSAVLLYASTILLNASEEGSSKLSDAISDTQELMCAFGIAAAVYIIVSFVLFARQRKFPTDMVMYLSLAQLLFPLSQLLCINSVIDDDYSSTKALFVYGASMTFRYWERTWVVLISINLLFFARRKWELANRMWKWYHVICWALSLVIGLVWGLAGSVDLSFTFQCMYRYGKAEAGFDVFTCVVALGFLMVSLVLVEKAHHAVPMPHDLTTVNKYSQWGRKGKKKEPCPPIPPQLRGPLPNADAAKSKPLSDVGAAGTASPGSGGGAGAGAGGAGAGAGAGTASERKHAADDALVEDASATVHDDSDVGDKFRLGLLISWFVVGLVLKATLALAYLGGSDLRSGAILQAAFVESIFNSGSGLVSLFTFGLSRPLLVEYAKTFTSLRRWYRTKAFGAQDVGFLASGAEAQSSPELLELIRDACGDNQLIKKRRYLLRSYDNCFVASEFVTWLVRTGRVTHREEGVAVATQLESANLIAHVEREHKFDDSFKFFEVCTDQFKPSAEIVELVSTIGKSKLLADRRWRIRTFKRCFVGYEAVSWMVAVGKAETRAQATKMLQRAMFHNMIEHVTRAHTFKDDELFYRLTTDDGRSSRSTSGSRKSAGKSGGNSAVVSQRNPMRQD